METILKEGYEKIMRVFYLNKEQKLHLRDIARKTNLNANSATRFLRQLEKLEILRSEKDGNLKKYSIRKTVRTFVMFSIFDNEKFSKLPNLRKKSINYFLEHLKVKPLVVLLFGSTAKENFRSKSGADLLLIVNDKVNTSNAEKYAESQTGININCFQIKYIDFVKELKFKEDKTIQSAVNSGYPIINSLFYYKEVYNG